MNDIDLKRIERESRELLDKLTPHLERVDVWVIAAAISRMLAIEPKLLPLVEGAVMAARAEAAHASDIDRLIAPPKTPLTLVKH